MILPSSPSTKFNRIKLRKLGRPQEILDFTEIHIAQNNRHTLNSMYSTVGQAQVSSQTYRELPELSELYAAKLHLRNINLDNSLSVMHAR